MAKTIAFRCTACGTVHYIPCAMAVACPKCSAAAGERCRDTRSADPKKYRLSVHPEREALLP
jgi:predicted  nucleic acid-binding Zn-ribbon protein